MRNEANRALAMLLALSGTNLEPARDYVDLRTGEQGRAPDLTVGQIRFGRKKPPTRRVRIWAWRQHAWRVSEPVHPADVEWRRLMEYDRVEIVQAEE